MAKLQVSKFAGAVESLDIADGPPTQCKVIESGAIGTVYGADGAPAIVELTPLGGDVAVTWDNGVTETLTSSVVRRLRGETVGVA